MYLDSDRLPASGPLSAVIADANVSSSSGVWGKPGPVSESRIYKVSAATSVR